ncbi:MAG: class I SAM-dependent methyltransferase [Isosphaeraceae bacterium]|nr:class I SAM-dependent methyltransferase [Isosphaeraceae bacterium]
MDVSKTSYDEIPYQNDPFSQTWPDRLAAVAKLFGLDAAPTDGCRVLELGCASGANVIAMAQALPGSRFVGVDASSRQIAEGWRIIGALGLKNIELKHIDILDVGEGFGEFDYVVSHGVFSWVPPAVQDRIIAICRQNLTPRGVAYVSYNTYPGWHIRGIVRDMMTYHGKQFRDPPTQLGQAKALVEFVVNALPGESNPYKQLLHKELENIGGYQDAYVHHEHLEENNQPLYFHEFARKLAVNGLQYLGEAEFASMVSTNFGAEIAATLQRIGAHDILQMEQYMDFVRCRTFRQTLICRAGVPLNRLLRPELVKGFLLSSRAVPENPEPSLAVANLEVFRTPSGSGLNCRHPLTKIALRIMAREWPMPLAFPALVAASQAEADRQGLPSEGAGAGDFLAGEMLAGMAAGVVEWRLTPPPFTTDPGEHPTTTPLARLQAAEGTKVSSLRGESIVLDGIHRHVLRHLDGTRDRAGLVEDLLAFLAEGGHTLLREEDQSPVTDKNEMRRLLDTASDKVLQNLARSALLVRQGRE